MTKIEENTETQNLIKKLQDIDELEKLLNARGIKYDKQKLGVLREKASNFFTLADRFNQAFSPHGWNATGDLNVNMMEAALEIFHSGDISQAEHYLCEQFDDAYFELHAPRMNALFVWKGSGRGELLELAYEDHKSQRYHASTPVVLAQIDGLAFDINKNTFFNNSKSVLILDESVSAHASGLHKISKKFSVSRNRTTMTQISMPFRHGIMHGRDLGYANKLVSTKAFFALFAMREWGLKCQHNELAKQMGKPHEVIAGFQVGDALKSKISNIVNS